MKFSLELNIPKPSSLINYKEKIFLIGSCFTEHIGNKLDDLRFDVLQNPHGIVFDVPAIQTAFQDYRINKKYSEDDLFLLNEIHHSWNHHSLFSSSNASESIAKINSSIDTAHAFLKETDWVIITLGTSFSYILKETQESVANCHKAPSTFFEKRMLEISELNEKLKAIIADIHSINKNSKIILTISPVRHIRDGVVENNRSKARLIEAVHQFTNSTDIFYFPAYELVIDILRDYRFYDIDFVHPNYMATEFVLEKFLSAYLDQESMEIMEEIKKIRAAQKHRPQHPNTNAHQTFLAANRERINALLKKYPHLKIEH